MTFYGCLWWYPELDEVDAMDAYHGYHWISNMMTCLLLMVTVYSAHP